MGTVIKEFQNKGELQAMEREVMSLGFGAYTGMCYVTSSDARHVAKISFASSGYRNSTSLIQVRRYMS